MATIEIETLEDVIECDACGMSYATGFRVRIDGEHAFELTPGAACFDGEDYSEADLFKRLLEHLGHDLVHSTEDDAYERALKAGGHSIERM